MFFIISRFSSFDQYSGSGGSTRIPSFLDYQTIISSLILDIIAPPKLRGIFSGTNPSELRADSPSIHPREVELFRRFYMAFDSLDSFPWGSFNVKEPVNALCLVCHTEYELYKRRPFSGCGAMAGTINLVFPGSGAAWKILTSSPPVDDFKGGTKSYCSYRQVQDFLYALKPTTRLEEVSDTLPENDRLLREGVEIRKLIELRDLKEEIVVGTLTANMLKMWVDELLQPFRDSGMGIQFKESSAPSTPVRFDPFSEIFINAPVWGMAWVCIFLFPLWRVIKTVMMDKELKLKVVTILPQIHQSIN